MTKPQRQLFGAEYAAFLNQDGEPVSTLTLDATKASENLTFFVSVNDDKGWCELVKLSAKRGEIRHLNIRATLLNQALVVHEGVACAQEIRAKGGVLSVSPHGEIKPARRTLRDRLSEHIKEVLDSVPVMTKEQVATVVVEAIAAYDAEAAHIHNTRDLTDR